MIEIKNATKQYGTGDNAVNALRGVTLTINSGDSIVLLGASGSGKSTLLNIVSGLERPTSTSTRINPNSEF